MALFIMQIGEFDNGFHFLLVSMLISNIYEFYSFSDVWFIDLLLDGDAVTTEMVMNFLLAGNKMYHRIDPRLPKVFPLDDVTLLQELQDFAWSVDLTETFKYVDHHFFYDDVSTQLFTEIDWLI